MYIDRWINNNKYGIYSEWDLNQLYRKLNNEIYMWIDGSGKYYLRKIAHNQNNTSMFLNMILVLLNKI